MSEENTDLEVHDFELIIGDAGGVIDNGDVPIRWCLTPEYVRKLEADGIVDPHVLITSYAPAEGDNGKISHCLEMDRKLVPLTQLMTYLRFYRAGEMKVIGIILNGVAGREALHKRYMKKHWDGRYSNIVYDYDGTLHDELEYAYATTSELVEIPANVFGKEPSPWVKWYVNLLHGSSTAVDECDYRKRMMLAFGLKWMLVIPYVFILIVGRALLTGIIAGAGYHKKTHFLRSFRVFKYPSISLNLFDTPIYWIDDNFFIYQRKFLGRNTYSFTSVAMLTGLAFTPILIALISGIVLFLEPAGVVGFLVLVGVAVGSFAAFFLFLDALTLLMELGMRHKAGEWLSDKVYNAFRFLTYGKRGDYWFYILIAISLATLAVLATYLTELVGLLAVLGGVMVILSVAMFIFGDKIGEWLDRLLTIPASENDYSKAAALLCPDEEDNLRPNINYIPKSKRTLRLRFLDFKNKVCKPMQR